MKHGTLRATSVGFLQLEKGMLGSGSEAQGQPNATYYYGRRELLEYSIVNIPSNSDATVRGKKTDAERMKDDIDQAVYINDTE